MKNCEFCETIYGNDDEYEKAYTRPWDEVPAIIRRGDEYGLYVPCEDSYYSRDILKIKYCPCCGRELIESELETISKRIKD